MATIQSPQGVTATPTQPRQMSSRLLTMKFMQRAASGVPSPSTPTSDAAHKRRKIDHTPDSSTPTTPANEGSAFASRSDVKAALQEEARRERLATEQRAALGYSHNMLETQWVLDLTQPAIELSRTIDENEETSDSSVSDGEDDWTEQGRQTFGGFNRNKAKESETSRQLGPLDEDSDDLASDNDSDVDRPGHHYNAMKKQKRTLDLDDDRAMAALDRVDLTKSSYAKAKGTMSGPPGKSFKFNEPRRDRRGDSHPKNQKHKAKARAKAKKY